MKNFILLPFSLFLIVNIAFAQEVPSEEEKIKKEDIRRPNIIKVNTLSIAFKNISVIYERGILPRLSAGLGIGYKLTGSEPTLFTVNSSEVSVNIDKIKGVTITPEMRYYLRACDPSLLDGFYAGVYLRYSRYWTEAKFDYMPLNAPIEQYKANMELSEFGLGLQLGYQMMIKERFTIDFLFFGPRISNYQFTYEFSEPPGEEFLGDLSDYINEVVDRFGYDYNVNIEKAGEKSGRTSFGFANMRFGLSLGVAF